jgi:hypothetical protein
MVSLLDSITPFNCQENSVKASILYGHIVVLNLMYDIKIPMEFDSLYLERLYEYSTGNISIILLFVNNVFSDF